MARRAGQALKPRDSPPQLGAESLADVLKRLAPEGVDVVIDAVGGPLTGQAVSGLARAGRVVVMGYVAGPRTGVSITDLVWKRASIAGFSLFASTPEQQAEAYQTLLPMIADGRIRPARDRSLNRSKASSRSWAARCWSDCPRAFA